MSRRDDEARLFSMPFARGDFLASTASWSSADRWRYLMALCDQFESRSNRVAISTVEHYWRADRRPVPAHVREKLARYTVVEDGTAYLRHPRTTRELQRIEAQHRQRVEAGKASAAARAAQRESLRESPRDSTRDVASTGKVDRDSSTTSDAQRGNGASTEVERSGSIHTHTHTQTQGTTETPLSPPQAGGEKRAARVSRRRGASVPDETAARYVDAWNHTFTKRQINASAGNLAAAKRAHAGGLSIEVFARAIVAVKAKSTPLARWCNDRGLRFDQLLRVEHRDDSGATKPGVAFRIDDELGQSTATKRVVDADGRKRDLVIGQSIERDDDDRE